MIICKNASAADMRQVSKVHVGCFPNYFLSSLGESLIEKYYLEFLNENDLFIIAIDDEKNQIVGFCMGYYKGSVARSNFESQNKMELSKRLFLLCLKFNKTAIQKCLTKIFGRFLKKQSASSSFKPDSDLLSIGVLPEYRGAGVAKRLIETFERRIFENADGRKIKNCTLSVYKTNDRARKFYEKMGYEVFSDGDEEVKYIKRFSID